MYHESLGIPRTKPALNLIYSIPSCILIMHRAKTVLYGGTCHFSQAQIMVDPISILLLPHFSLFFSSKAQNKFFLFCFVAHSRTSFACLTTPEPFKKKLKKEKKITYHICTLKITPAPPPSPHRGHGWEERKGRWFDRFFHR